MFFHMMSTPVMAFRGDSAVAARRAKDHFISGSTLQLMGNRHGEAVLEFQQSLRYDSSAVTAAAMTRSLIELRKFSMAQESARLATRLDSTYAEAWELLAEVLVNEGRYDDAVAAYERLRALQPNRRQLYTLARLYEPRNARRAADIYETLVRTDPDVTIYERLAALYTRLRDYAGLARALEGASALDPINPAIARDLAPLLFRLHRHGDALRVLMAWSNAIQPSESEVDVWTSALAYVVDDSTVFAAPQPTDTLIFVVDRALERFQSSWPVMVLSGALSLRLADHRRAARCFEACLKASGATADAPLQVAGAWFSNGEWQRGFDVLARTAPQFGSDARFPYLMGIACMNMNNDSAARVMFDHTVHIDSMYTDAWVQLGMLRDMAGLQEASDIAYERALSIEPDNHLANNNYAYSLAVRGQRLDRARVMSWKAVQQVPGSASYLDTYAWVLFKQGDLDAARSAIERAIARGGSATNYDHYGDILEALGQLDDAVRAWQKALDLDPDRLSVASKISRYR